MNKNILFKVFSVFLSFIIMLSIGNNVFANDVTTPETGEIIEEYANIRTIASSIYKSGVTAHCVTTVEAKARYKITIRQILQRKDGSSWITLDHWDTTTTGTYLRAENTRLINVLKDYRLVSRVTVGSETTTVYEYLS